MTGEDMEKVFVTKLKPFLDAVAEKMDLFVPKKTSEHYVFRKYDPESGNPSGYDYNNIRSCATAKEFLFPVCELAAVFPQAAEPEPIKPFAVFGLKDCDLRSLAVLDKVFLEDEYEDTLYAKRRENMFIISSDCFDPAKTCFCNVLGGQSYAKEGYDLNVAKVRDGFVIEAGSEKGRDFLKQNSIMFIDVPDSLLAERDKNREKTQQQLGENNAQYQLDKSAKEIVENSTDSKVFDEEAGGCVECQGCTRICPTCHCFYLYDSKKEDYFTKMKMWDSCLRLSYAEVAGGENPRKVLSDRIRHRLLHKFVYFMDRYGIDMCVGCGRCMEGCIGQTDMRALLKKLNEDLKVAK